MVNDFRGYRDDSLSFQEITHRGMHGQNACIVPCLFCGILMPAGLQVRGQDHGCSVIRGMIWCGGSGEGAECALLLYSVLAEYRTSCQVRQSQPAGGRERRISAASRPSPVKGTARVAAMSSANTRV